MSENLNFIGKMFGAKIIRQSRKDRDGHPHINPVREVIMGATRTYLIFPPCSTDLHSYVRTRRRLKEPHARTLFKQIVSAVHEAHSKGIVLRDLKLRKFIFNTESR